MQLTNEALSKIDYSQNRMLIDWFSFSSRIDSFESMAKLIGLSSVTWDCTSGVNGYRYRYYYDGISIHVGDADSLRFSGTSFERPVKGVWLEMSGSGCRTYESHTTNKGDIWQILIDYVVDNSDDITVNRVDLAYDDFIGLLDINKIVSDTYAHNFISKFRADPEIIAKVGIDEIAYTVEHGRMKSDTFIRIYDKRLEQHAQEFTDHWIRNEIMLRHDRAYVCLSLMSTNNNDGKSISEIYFMIMNNYLRYIDPSDTDSNLWRAPLAEHWKKFSESVTTYRISLWSAPGTDYSSLRLDRFVEKQCGGALYTYITLHGVDHLVSTVQKNFYNLAPKYKLLLSELDDNEEDEEGNNEPNKC